MNSISLLIDHAAQLLGGRSELARLLGVTPAAIGNWKVRGVPIEHCPAIERLTCKQVSRQALRPTDWYHIWPELAESSNKKKAVALANKASAAIDAQAA